MEFISKLIFVSFQPHEVPDRWKMSAPRSRSVSDDRLSVQSDTSLARRGPGSTMTTSTTSQKTFLGNGKLPAVKSKSVQPKCPRTNRLDKLEMTLQKLLAQTPVKCRVDASYLLEHDKRTRKRPPVKNSE